MTNRLRRILRGESIAPKTLDEKAVKEAVQNANSTYDIAFSADITTDPTKPTAATTASFADALQAQTEGKTLRAVIDFGDGVAKYGTQLAYFPTEGSEEIAFFAVAIIGSAVYYIQVTWNDDGAGISLTELEVAT